MRIPSPQEGRLSVEPLGRFEAANKIIAQSKKEEEARKGVSTTLYGTRGRRRSAPAGPRTALSAPTAQNAGTDASVTSALSKGL